MRELKGTKHISIKLAKYEKKERVLENLKFEHRMDEVIKSDEYELTVDDGILIITYKFSTDSQNYLYLEQYITIKN